MAVKFFVENYKFYLCGREFTAGTDHQALKGLFSFKKPKYHMARWIQTLSSYNVTLEYRQENNMAIPTAFEGVP